MGHLTSDLLVAFVSPHHAMGYDRLPELICKEFPAGAFIGCSGGGVIGAGREVEDRPGFAMTVAHLPDVEVAPLHVETADLPDADAAPDRWEDLTNVGTEDPHFILLVDPFSFDAEQLVMGLDYAYYSGAKIGGMTSSAARAPCF